MANGDLATPELRTTGAFEEETPSTPLLDFTSQLGIGPTTGQLMADRQRAASERQAASEAVQRRFAGAAGELEQLQRGQAAEREALRPVPPSLPTPPPTETRPLFMPGPNAPLLSQLNHAMLAIGNMALQIGGFKGNALAATAAIKGATEGWIAGDQERVQRELTSFDNQTKKILTEHKLATDRFRDLLGEHRMTTEEKMATLGLELKGLQFDAAAKAADVHDYDQLLKFYQTMEMQQATMRWHYDTLAATMEHQRATEQQARDMLASQEKRTLETQRLTEEYRKANLLHQQETERLSRARLGLSERAADRADEALALRKLTNKQVTDLDAEDLAIHSKMNQVHDVRESIALLQKEGVLPAGPTTIDRGKAALLLQTKLGRADVGLAVETVKRFGTALLAAREIDLGMTAGMMRLKAIAEAEAGNVMAAPKAFWDVALRTSLENLTARQAMVRQRRAALAQLGGAPIINVPAPGGGAAESPGAWKVED